MLVTGYFVMYSHNEIETDYRLIVRKSLRRGCLKDPALASQLNILGADF